MIRAGGLSKRRRRPRQPSRSGWTMLLGALAMVTASGSSVRSIRTCRRCWVADPGRDLDAATAELVTAVLRAIAVDAVVRVAMSTLAEDLTLLLIDPETGKPLVDGTSFDRAVGGALLLDLTAAGRVAADGTNARAKLTIDPAPTGDALLDGALERIGEKPVRASRAVEKLARHSRGQVLARLSAAGVLGEERGRALGIIPTTSWRTLDPRPRAALQGGVTAVLSRKADPDERQAGLISLLHAVRAEHKIVDGARGELRDRAKEVADGDWAGAAVKQAVQAVQATIMAAVVASSAGGAAAGSS